MMARMTNNFALLVGGARGIGLAIAERLWRRYGGVSHAAIRKRQPFTNLVKPIHHATGQKANARPREPHLCLNPGQFTGSPPRLAQSFVNVSRC